eukprot:750349-Hanusia_phi.AAC.3
MLSQTKGQWIGKQQVMDPLSPQYEPYVLELDPATKYVWCQVQEEGQDEDGEGDGKEKHGGEGRKTKTGRRTRGGGGTHFMLLSVRCEHATAILRWSEPSSLRDQARALHVGRRSWRSEGEGGAVRM